MTKLSEFYNANFLDNTINKAKKRLIKVLSKFIACHNQDGKYHIEFLSYDGEYEYFIPQYIVFHGTQLFVQYINHEEFGNINAEMFEQHIEEFSFKDLLYIYTIIINNEKELGNYKY